MKKNAGFLIALTLLAVVGGTVAYLMVQDAKPSGETPPGETRVFPDDLKGVNRATLRKPGEAPLTIALVGDAAKDKPGEALETWRIEEPAAYKADPIIAGELLGTLRTLDAERVIDAPAEDASGFGLESPMLSIDLRVGETNRKLEIGAINPTGSARYARVSGSPKLYMLSVANVTTLNKSLADLRFKRVFDLTEFSLERLRIETPGGNREIVRGPQRLWTFASPDGFRADQTIMGEFVSSVANARVDAATLAKPSLEETRFQSLPLVATVSAHLPEKQLQAVFRRGSDNVIYAKSEDLSGIYPVAVDFDTYLKKSMDEFRNLKLYEFGFNDVFTLRYEAGAKTFTLKKPNDQWQLDGKTMDSAKANKLIDELRTAAGSAYLEGTVPGSVTRMVEVETAGGTKERVEFHESEGSAFAVRVGEKGYYKLPENVLKDITKAATEIQAGEQKP